MPSPFPPVFCTVSKAAGAVPSVPLWDGPKWQHGEEHKEQLPGDALAHGQVQPERGGGRPEQSENRVGGCQHTGRDGKEMEKKPGLLLHQETQGRLSNRKRAEEREKMGWKKCRGMCLVC